MIWNKELKYITKYLENNVLIIKKLDNRNWAEGVLLDT